MTGSNLAGMTGSNLAGMTGSNLAGMTGSNLARCGRTSARFADGFAVAAMGSVDAVSSSQEGTRIVVAGQSFGISSSDVDLFHIGDYVVAASPRVDSPAVVYHVGVPYVAGVSPVRVKGAVTAVDSGKGALSISNLTLDYTPQLAAAPLLQPQIGDTVQAVGVQPAAEGIMVLGTCASGLVLDRD
jgi:hypothetical protein